jgi:uncharacterized protein YndB with AHSA1/START domain
MSNKSNDKNISFEFLLAAPVEIVYKVWTTKEGLESFFAPECRIDLKLLGDLHIHFFPENKEGQKGAEDEKIISFEENKMLSFTWGFPPSIINLRNTQKTVVRLRFNDTGFGQTIVSFTQTGWGESDEWQLGYEYFCEAWGNVVLARLQYMFENGAIDWNNLHDYSAYSLSK